MSRTYRRKNATKTHYMYSDAEWIEFVAKRKNVSVDKAKEQHDAHFHSDACFTYTFPKWYRTYVSQLNRRNDKHEIWKAINWHDYPEQCSLSNCKYKDPWWFW